MVAKATARAMKASGDVVRLDALAIEARRRVIDLIEKINVKHVAGAKRP